MARLWKTVDFDPIDSTKVAAVKISRTMFQQAMSYEEGTMKGEDIEALHDMRVSIRRLRAVLKIFEGCFEGRRLRKQEKILQTLTKSLGAVREHDVFIAQLQEFRKGLSDSEGRVIDLLIAREATLQHYARKALLKEFRSLRRRNYRSAFEDFLSRT
jgi:CHAD domain-containing protein